MSFDGTNFYIKDGADTVSKKLGEKTCDHLYIATGSPWTITLSDLEVGKIYQIVQCSKNSNTGGALQYKISAISGASSATYEYRAQVAVNSGFHATAYWSFEATSTEAKLKINLGDDGRFDAGTHFFWFIKQ